MHSSIWQDIFRGNWKAFHWRGLNDFSFFFFKEKFEERDGAADVVLERTKGGGGIVKAFGSRIGEASGGTQTGFRVM